MKRTEIVEEKISRYKVVEKRCDMCWKEEKEWEVEYDEFTFKSKGIQTDTRININANISRRYHAGDSWGFEWYIDICPECFINKLIPFIESFGHTKIEPFEY